jgi:hypothetical protein
MNRQKKELLKKIHEAKMWIELDIEWGGGFAPPGAYDEMYREIYRFQEELAHLRHYKTADEMYLDEMSRDERGRLKVEEIPRQAEPTQSKKQRRSRNHSKGMER